ncbi:MAG: hypothetical protein QW666_04040, partial [Candidatus Woesearchaeota archaeon]
MVPNVIPEQTISIIKKEVIKYKQYLHLFEIKKALLGPADYDLRTFLDQYLPHMQIDFPAIVANLNSIITNQKRILQNEIIDFNGLCEFYKNVVRYNPQAGNIKKALEELYTNTDKCRQVLHKLWVNLLKQE